MQQLGICVIGAGDLGRRHSDCWRQVEGTELIATVDIQEDRAHAAQDEFGFRAWFTDYREALKEPGINIVSVCVPNYLHSEMSVRAMETFCFSPVESFSKRRSRMSSMSSEAKIASVRRRMVSSSSPVRRPK